LTSHFLQASGGHVVNEAAHRQVIRHKRVLVNAFRVILHAGFQVTEGQPLDLRPLCRAWPHAHVAPALLVDDSSVEAAGEQVAHDLVGEQLHAAVGVVNDEKLLRAQQLVRDHQRTDGVVAGPPTGVANHVGVALGQPGEMGRVEAGVHACQNGKLAARRQRQLGFAPERLGVLGVGGQNLVQNF
jgi:hypothetical protein